MKKIFTCFLLAIILLLASSYQSVAEAVGASYTTPSIFIDKAINNLAINNSFVQPHTLQLFSHGRPGQLLLNGQWKTPIEIVAFLKEEKLLSKKINQLNIYGCEFAKGQIGLDAVAYLKNTLGIEVSASTNITGKGGDWVLEAGKRQEIKGLDSYPYSLQCNATGGSTQNANDGGTFAWGGPTASTVTVSLTTTTNSASQQVVVALNTSGSGSYTGTTNGSFTETFAKQWNKNGGHTGNGTAVNNFVGQVVLTFSTPVPANEIFLIISDMDQLGVVGTAADGSITFGGGSQATPADFEPLSWGLAGQHQTPYSTVDGSLNLSFITTNTSNANGYVALAGKTTKKVSRIAMFIRNIQDDVQFRVGWIKPCSLLPVKLESFSGQFASANIVKLNWSVGEDAAHYEVERSTDGRLFTKVAAIAAANKTNYNYSDNLTTTLIGQTLYYRLKMVSDDGSFTYSNILALKPNTNGNGELSIFPNPAHSSVFVNYNASQSGLLQINMFNAMGQKVTAKQQLVQTGKNIITMDGLDKLPSGTYYLNVTTAIGTAQVIKVNLQ